MLCTVQFHHHATHCSAASYLESVASHADLIFRDKVGAFFLGVVRVREEHALVALRLFVGADAAGLGPMSVA